MHGPGWLLVLGLLTAAQADESVPPGFPMRRGALAFCHASTLAEGHPGDREIDWLSRFDAILTNGYGVASEETRRYLQARGSRLFLYFWTGGFVAAELGAELPDGLWRQDVVGGHPDWLLSPEPIEGPPGSSIAYYFDLGNPAVCAYIAEVLRQFRSQTGYDGIFFDYAGEMGLGSEARAHWQARHPGLPNDCAVLGLLQGLRRADPDVLIATNQAFRSVEAIATEADYDLAESYATSFAWGKEGVVGGRTLAETFRRPWSGPGGIEAYYSAVQRGLHLTSPHRGFVFLDYMRPWFVATEEGPGPVLDVGAVYYSYVAAKLWGLEAFCSGWYATDEYRGPLYFADLGRPLGDGPTQQDGLALREYERGLVAMLTAPRPAATAWRLCEPGTGHLLDMQSGRRAPVDGDLARVSLDPAKSELTDEPYPTATVYLKAN